MTTKINFLKRKSARDKAWKALNFVVGLSMVFNMTMVGALIKPSVARAEITTPTGYYTWSFEGMTTNGGQQTWSYRLTEVGKAKQVSHISLDVCGNCQSHLASTSPAGGQWVDNDGSLGISGVVQWDANETLFTDAGSNETQVFSFTLNTIYGTDSNGTHAYVKYSTENDNAILPGPSCTPVTTKIELKKIWSGTPNQTTLTIGTTPGYNDIASQQTGSAGAPPLTTGAIAVVPGTYYLGEHDGLGLYTRGPLVCKYASGAPVSVGQYDSVIVATGDNIVCSITNTYSNSYIVVKKLVDPSTDPTKFGFSGDISGSLGHTQSIGRHVVPGKYTVTEDALPAGWSLNSISCDKAGGTGDTATRTATYNVGVNETITCTFTNKLTPPDTGKISGYKKDGQDNKLNGWEICLKKHADGWDKKTCVTTGSNAWPTGYYEFTGLQDNHYDLRETLKTNWYAIDPVSGGYTDIHVDSTSNLQRDFKNGQYGSITVKKITDPTSATDKFSFSGAIDDSLGNNQTASESVKPGTYNVTEASKAGWDLTSLTCDDTNSAGDLVNRKATFNVEAGENVMCTFTNTRKPITIKATKIVCDNESDLPNWGLGGPNISATTATDWINGNVTNKISAHPGCHLATGWDFQWASGSTANPGDNTGVASTGWTTFGSTDINGLATATVSDIHNWNSLYVREVWKDGYIPFTYNQTNPSSNRNNVSAEMYCHQDVINYDNYDRVDFPVAGPVYGQTYYCVAFNVAKTTNLTVIKHVNNDNGGQATANQWKIHVTQNDTDVSGSPQNGTENGTVYTLPYGTYQVTETGGIPGYSPSIVCDGQKTNIITLDSATPKTCTITNDDVAPSLTLVKNVDNTGGGIATKYAWQLSATGPVTLSGYGGAVSDNTFKAGTYTLSETGNAPGYTAGTWVCDGGTLVGNQVTLALGESVYCSITNTFNPLTIDKKVDGVKSNTALPGEVLTYTVTVTNPGNQDVTNAVVTDVVSTYLTPVLPIPGYDSATRTITWQGFTIVAGGTITFTYQATIASVMTKPITDITNTAVLGPTCVKPNVAALSVESIRPVQCWDGSSTVTTNVNANPTILIVKTAAATVTAGTNLVYTLNWSVQGSLPVTNAIITDPLPINTTFVSADNGGVNNSGIVTWSLGSKNPGDSGTVTFTVKVAAPLTNGTVLTNTATFDTTENTPVTSTVLTTVQSSPALSITKTNNLTTFTNPNQQVTYTVVVTNAATATDAAKNVVLTDTLPMGFTYADNGLTTRTFSLGDIAVGASVTKTYLVNIGSVTTGTYTNTASAKGDNTGTVTATSNVDVRVPQVLGATTEPILSITKTVSSATAKPGQVITYTLTIHNSGDADAENIVIVDTLPKGFTFLDDSTAQKILNLGTLEPDHTRVINLDVTVGSKVKAGKYTNVALMTATGLEQQEATADVTVKVPQVLGLATTGPTWRDLAIFIGGAGLLALGIYLAARRRESLNAA